MSAVVASFSLLVHDLPLQRRLTTKILFSFFTFLAFALCAIGATLLLSWQLEGSGAAINDAGSLRMRTFQLARDMENVAAGVGDTRALTQRAADFETTLTRLETGDPSRPLFVPRRPEILTALTAVRRGWDGTLKPLITDTLNAPQAPSARQTARAFSAASDAFVENINQMVNDIEDHNARKTEWLRLCQMALASMAVLGTVAMIFLMFLLAIRPLERLNAGIQRLAAGDFSTQVPVETHDEFGEITTAFNQMARRLAEANATLESRVEEKTASLQQKNKELSLLYEITAFLNRPASVDELCSGFLTRVMAECGAEGGAVRLTDTAQGLLYLVAQSGLPPALTEEEHCIKIGDCICGEAAASASASRIESFDTDPDKARSLRECYRQGFNMVSAFTISTQSRTLGQFNLHFRDSKIFTRQQVLLLETLGQHLGGALENQRLAAKARELAVLEERNLFAQGLHDSIAQGLSFLNLQAQIMAQAVDEKDQQATEETLAHIRLGIRESYDDVRELLNNFRSNLSAENLSSAIEAVLDRFRRQTGMRVELQKDSQGAPLQPDQQLQILFILQESLSNVRKHAQASRVVVRLEDAQDLTLTVLDNGVGFDADEVAARPSGHYGLTIMRERAQRAGLTLHIDPAYPHGTRVALFLPKDHRHSA